MYIQDKMYSFDDVMLVPKQGILHSRSEADLSTTIAGLELRIPIIAANMSSICETQMAQAIGDRGGLGIIHRMNTPDEQLALVKAVNYQREIDSQVHVGFSIGIGRDWMERMELCRHHADIVCLDVAHGHHNRVLALLEKYFKTYKSFPIIIGQIATAEAAEMILDYIPHEYRYSVAFKTSIGGGSLCTTRIQTGFGVPTLQAVLDITNDLSADVAVIADGGIKNAGDIVKSLAAGASAVMLGNLLSGTDETPGDILHEGSLVEYKEYRGSASFSDKTARGEAGRHVEGEHTYVPRKGPVAGVINNLLDGIRSGLSYGGATNIAGLRQNAEFREITVHGYRESLPHGKEK